MDTERLITRLWVRRFNLLAQVNVADDDELNRGNRENQAIDRAAGIALYIAQCLSRVAWDTGRLADIPAFLRTVRELPAIDEKETLSGWGRRIGHGPFEEGVEIIKVITPATTAAGIMDRLDAFGRESVHQMMALFLEDREKMKHEEKSKEVAG